MNEQRILEELLALLVANNVTIRREPLGGNGGGLCSIKGQQIFFLDTQASSAESAGLCLPCRQRDGRKAFLVLASFETESYDPSVRSLR